MASERRIIRLAAAGFLALALAMGIGRFAFTPLLPMMQSEGLVTIAGGGLIASIHFAGYLAGALLAGRIGGSPRFVLQASLLAIAVTTLGMGLTSDMLVWTFCRGLAGVFSAIVLVVVGNELVRRMSEQSHADKQGWIFSGVGGGIALVGFATLGMMAAGTASAVAWLWLGAAALIGCFAIDALIGRHISRPVAAGVHGTRQRTPLDWTLIVAYGATGIGYIIPATFLPVMARAAAPSPLVFGWAWPIFGTATFLSTLLAARLFARASNRRIWQIAQCVMAVGLLLPVADPGLTAVTVAGLCVGGTFMIVTMVSFREAHRLAGDDARRHIAALTASFAAGQVAGPVIAGWLHGLAGSFTLPLVLASAALVATAITLTRGSDAKKTIKKTNKELAHS